jgi:cysteine desulfurase
MTTVTGEARIYLDHNASAPMLPEAIEAMRDAFALPGNPSSIHREGRAARAVIENASRSLSSALGGKPSDIVFTSGGTESAAMLLSPEWAVQGDRRIFSDLLVLSTDHACLLAGGSFSGTSIRRIPVQADGLVDLAALDRMLSASAFALVAIQHANNETGIIQPVAEIAALARQHLALIVLDAVQSFGKIPVDLAGLGVDALFVSGHKIGGPKGVGAVLFADSRVTPARPLIAGGGQQRGFRAGTENVPGIAGLGAAARMTGQRLAAASAMADLRDGFESSLRGIADDLVIFGSQGPRLPNTSLFALPGFSAEASLIAFDLAGFAVSSGSACSSGKVKRSHVLEAMGVPAEMAACAIRFSIGPETKKADIDAFLEAIRHRVAPAKRNMMEMAAAAA